jgi:hypothetical protein
MGLPDRTRLPLVPETVTQELPVGASAAAVTVIVEVPDPATDDGEKVTVVPAD